MTKLSGLFLACALVIGTAAAGLAQEEETAPTRGRGLVPQACADDAQNFCPNVQGLAARRCLREHSDELSETCQSSLAAARPGAGRAAAGGRAAGARGGGALTAACGEDMNKLCADQQGRARFQCLTAHESELSDGCRAVFQQIRSRTRRGGDDS